MHIALKNTPKITFLAWGLLALGVVLRLRQYLVNRSLWLDEAMLALNIIQRNFAGLMLPLDNDQGAPLGFLWLTKAAQLLLGEREQALRFLPLLAGFAALLLLHLFLSRSVRPSSALFALAAFAISQYAIAYGTQVKQYASDTAIALALWLWTLPDFERPPTPRRALILGLAGGLAVWMSHPAVFVLGGLGATWVLNALRQKAWKNALLHAATAAFWFANFLALYVLQYQSLTTNQNLTDFWAEFFMPWGNWGAIPGWVLLRFEGLFLNPLGLSASVPGLVFFLLFLLGGYALWHSPRRGWALAYGLTLLLTLAASALGKYPFGGRLVLFAMPGLLVFVSAAFDALASLPKPRLGSAVALALAVWMLASPVMFAVETFIKPKMTEHIAPSMAYLRENYREGDTIYLYHRAVPAYTFYADKYGLQHAATLESVMSTRQPENYLRELDALKGQKRVWVLFSHITETSFLNEKDYILAYLDDMGEQKRPFIVPGTSVYLYLYDLR